MQKIDCFFRGFWREVYRIDTIDASLPKALADPKPMKYTQPIKDLANAHINDGKTTAEIAEYLKVSQRSVQRWRKQEQCQRSKQMEGVKRRKLTQEQEQAVLELIAGRPGSVLENIVEYVSETFLVTISRFTASRMSKRYGLTRKRGTRVNLRYNADKGLQLLEDIRSSFFPLLASCWSCWTLLRRTDTPLEVKEP